MAVVVPKGTGIFPAGARKDGGRRTPWAGHSGCSGDKYAFVRRGEVNVKQTIVGTNGGGPDSTSVAGATSHIVFGRQIDARECMAHELPMNEIARVQYRNARNEVKTGSD
jgi:hypothetical protein